MVIEIPQLELWFQCRKKDDGTYEATTWQINFNLDSVEQGGTYKLRIALATANIAELQVRSSIA